MRLTGPEYTELSGVLGDAFADYQELGLVLRRAGKRIQDITPPAAMPLVIDAVIQYAETRDWVHELIGAARAANPSNVGLLKVAAAIGSEPGGVAPGSVPAETALPAVAARLERMVDSGRGIADLGSFAARLHELLRQVCAVELGTEYGTGFLIGPETVLTNHHVVADAIAGSFDPANIRLRFDFQRLRDGVTTNGGQTAELADDWLVDAETHSPADESAYDEASLPAEQELDYAVLRTKEHVGRQLSSGPAGTERGWLVPRAQAYAFPPNSFLMVVQHPCHDPISFDDVEEAVVRVNPNGTRVHYRNNTMPGSSGSPVLDRNLELVALHHAGEPGSPDVFLPCKQQVTPAAYNEGIPIQKIQARLAAKGLAWAFGGEAP